MRSLESMPPYGSSFQLSLTPTTEPLDCFLGHRREEINQITVRIAKQHSTIPHGIVVGSFTHSSTNGFKRSYSASTSWTWNSIMTVRLLAATAEPAPNSCTVWEWPIARVHDGITSSAKTGAGAFRRNTRNFLIELDKTIHVISNDTHRSKIHEISSFL